VDRVVPDAEVYDVARALVARPPPGPALALRAAKQAIDDGLETDQTPGWRSSSCSLRGCSPPRTSAPECSFVENGPGKATFAGQ
jgi:hypothetical protein